MLCSSTYFPGRRSCIRPVSHGRISQRRELVFHGPFVLPPSAFNSLRLSSVPKSVACFASRLVKNKMAKKMGANCQSASASNFQKRLASQTNTRSPIMPFIREVCENVSLGRIRGGVRFHYRLWDGKTVMRRN